MHCQDTPNQQIEIGERYENFQEDISFQRLTFHKFSLAFRHHRVGQRTKSVATTSLPVITTMELHDFFTLVLLLSPGLLLSVLVMAGMSAGG